MLWAMHRLDFKHPQPLHNTKSLRDLEIELAKSLPPHTLMQRAGLATARLALALTPHAHCVWIACGPGNNGGDGLEAAMHLHSWGKSVVVTRLGDEAFLPTDARQSLERARSAGVVFREAPPQKPDLCIDALLGIGCGRSPQGLMVDWLLTMLSSEVPLLNVDLPSGLNTDTGELYSGLIAKYTAAASQNRLFTLSLLGLKPGQFTNQGRDACGEIWFDDLNAPAPNSTFPPTAQLSGSPALTLAPHTSHKGSFGDVLVVGGDVGMTGAAILAGDAALHAGAGRVYVSLLDPSTPHQDTGRPALMMREWSTLDLKNMTVVCGCGAGDAVKDVVLQMIDGAGRLVLDADALNLIAQDIHLGERIRLRGLGRLPTVLTPHPLEAARLISLTTQAIQTDRMQAAQALANKFACTVLLKGSGSIIATPKELPVINPTGNGRLATAGTGDVLAGLVGARLAQGLTAHDAAVSAAWQHGHLAQTWPEGLALTADRLAQSLSR